MICRSWESQLQLLIFSKEKIQIIQKPIQMTHSNNLQTKFRRIETNEIDTNLLTRNLELHLQIWDYHVDQCDEIWWAYNKFGPFQPHLQEYEKSGLEGHLCRFQYTWFKLFPSWLEYSPTKDVAFCLPCFLFNRPSGELGANCIHYWGI